MSLFPSLLRLARQCQCSWLRPQQSSGALRAAAAAGAGGVGLPPLPAPRRSGGRCLSSSSTSRASSGVPSTPPQQRQQQQQRRSVAVAARRGSNVFLDDDAQSRGKARGQEEEDINEPKTAAMLFDSSRFNYDSDEDEEQGTTSTEAAQEEQQGTAATAAAGAAAQQQRRAAFRAAASEAGVTVDDGSAAPVDIVLPPPRGTAVKTAEFIKSSVTVEQCPPARFPEFAVIGRSNVGKSSLINMLTGRTALAMVSKTPGKTRCINHFLINGRWYLVDLPGYGYARTSKTNVVEWNNFTRQYFRERETLVTVLLLVDASIPPMPLDISCAAWFADAEIPFTIVFTKLDKRKKGGPAAKDNIAAFEAAVEEACGYAPPSIQTSARSGKGRSELLAHVAQLRDFFNKNNHGM